MLRCVIGLVILPCTPPNVTVDVYNLCSLYHYKTLFSIFNDNNTINVVKYGLQMADTSINIIERSLVVVNM